MDPSDGVIGDEVALGGDIAADPVIGWGPLERNPSVCVAQRRGAVNIGADVITSDYVASRAGIQNSNTKAVVTGDEVAFGGIARAVAIGADAAVGRPIVDPHTLRGVA